MTQRKHTEVDAEPWLMKARDYGEKLESSVEAIPEIFPEILNIPRPYEEKKKSALNPKGIFHQLYCWYHDLLWPLMLGDILLSTGDREGALKRYRRCLPVENSAFTLPILADPDHYIQFQKAVHLLKRLQELGDEESAQSVLSILGNPELMGLSRVSYTYLQIGEMEKAREYLEQAHKKEVEKDKEEEFGYELNWLAIQLKDTSMMEATIQRRLESLESPIAKYNVLKKNDKDTTEHLKALLTEAKERGVYDTAYVAAMLLGDKDECDRSITLDKERGSKHTKNTKDISLYWSGAFDINVIREPELLSIPLENDHFRDRFYSWIRNIEQKNPYLSMEGYVLLGSQRDIERLLMKKEKEYLRKIRKRNRKWAEMSTTESDKEGSEKYNSVITAYYIATGLCFTGYGRLKESQEKP